jgi:hypothetical protein
MPHKLYNKKNLVDYKIQVLWILYRQFKKKDFDLLPLWLFCLMEIHTSVIYK